VSADGQDSDVLMDATRDEKKRNARQLSRDESKSMKARHDQSCDDDVFSQSWNIHSLFDIGFIGPLLYRLTKIQPGKSLHATHASKRSPSQGSTADTVVAVIKTLFSIKTDQYGTERDGLECSSLM
jgi:hypothetical protein